MGIKPFFASAPRITIKIGDKKLAYAIGINMSVSVDVRPVMVIGAYAPAVYEPVMYGTVSGSMQIVKMVGATAEAARKAAADKLTRKTDITDTITTGTSESEPAVTGQEDNSVLKVQPGAGKDALENHLNPKKVILSETFDIIMELALPGLSATTFLTIKDCRLSGRSANISMAQLVSEAVSFQGLLAIPDAQDFAADNKNQDG